MAKHSIYSITRLSEGLEGQPLRLRITRSGETSTAGSVAVRTRSGSAVSGLDFRPLSEQISFAPGETSRDIVVDVLADDLKEKTESFAVQLLRRNPSDRLAVAAINLSIANVAPSTPAPASTPTPTPTQTAPAVPASSGQQITGSVVIKANLSKAGEVDPYPLSVAAGSIVTASVVAAEPNLYPLIDLLDSKGTVIKKPIAFGADSADLGMVDLLTGQGQFKVKAQVGGVGDYTLQVDVLTREKIKAEVVRLTNLERERAGLTPLQRNALLDQAAQNHVQDMDVSNRYLAHTGSNGSTPVDRIRATGYKAGWVDVGGGALRTISSENAASGQRSAAEVVDGWMNSPGHRAAIMDPATKEIGVGFEIDEETGSTYWIQAFGHPWQSGMEVWF